LLISARAELSIVSVLIDIFSIIGEVLFIILRATWWIVVPVFLFNKVKPLYRFDKVLQYFRGLEFILLEIKLPPDVLKTPKAMETKFSTLGNRANGAAKRNDPIRLSPKAILTV